jgi:hypothetical protein
MSRDIDTAFSILIASVLGLRFLRRLVFGGFSRMIHVDRWDGFYTYIWEAFGADMDLRWTGSDA